MINNKQIFDRACQLINETKKLITEKDWDSEMFNNINVESKILSNACSHPCYRITTLSNKKPDDLLNYLWNEQEMNKHLNNSSISEWSLIETSDNARICTQKNNLIWPLNDRRSTYVQMKFMDKTSIWFVSFSVDHPSVKLESDCVKVNVNRMIYRFTIENDKTRIWKFALVDPGCTIPNILNFFFMDELTKDMKYWSSA